MKIIAYSFCNHLRYCTMMVHHAPTVSTNLHAGLRSGLKRSHKNMPLGRWHRRHPVPPPHTSRPVARRSTLPPSLHFRLLPRAIFAARARRSAPRSPRRAGACRPANRLDVVARLDTKADGAAPSTRRSSAVAVTRSPTGVAATVTDVEVNPETLVAGRREVLDHKGRHVDRRRCRQHGDAARADERRGVFGRDHDLWRFR